MHSALLSKSDRLKRVFNLLLDGQKHSTRDIVMGASVMAVSAVVSELRENGIDIECQREGAIWRYWLKNSV
jgi:biotin operon repressor